MLWLWLRVIICVSSPLKAFLECEPTCFVLWASVLEISLGDVEQ